MEIVYSSSSTELLKIRKTTTVNGNDCYELLTHERESPRYVFTPQSTTYMALKHNDAIHIFNLKDDGNFPPEFKQYIDEIKEDLRRGVSDANAIRTKINAENQFKFVIIHQGIYLPQRNVNLERAKTHVQNLNAKLQLACPDFYLHISYITQFPEGSRASLDRDLIVNSYFDPQIILCLFTGNHCVSSIRFRFAENIAFIYSKTNPQYERRNLNTVLLTVAIMISNIYVDRLSSEDDESASLMVTVFKATVSHGMSNTHVIDLNPSNVEKANGVFDETIKQLCGPVSEYIIYSSTELLEIRKTNTVNGNDCYAIRTNEHECPVRYVFTPQSTTYMALKYNDAVHIFNLKQDGVFPDDFKDYIKTIEPNLHRYFESGVKRGLLNSLVYSNEEDDIRIRINSTNPFHFVYIRQTTTEPCREFIQLENAKMMIVKLNKKLLPTCPDFHLNLDYITSFPADSTASLYNEAILVYPNSYFQPPLVLCLFTGNDCVSSITIKLMGESGLTIDSRTNERYEGRKFNTLLRAVAIMISKSLNERVERLTSDATNIISAFLMIKRFNAVSQEGDIDKSTKNLDTVIRDYFHHREDMITYVELNEVNLANAATVFDETIQRMNCKPLEPIAGGLKRTNRIRNPKKTMKTRNQKKTIKTRNPKKTRKTKKTRRTRKQIKKPRKQIRKPRNPMKTMKTIQ
jgi:hypothetical protein